MTAPSVVISDRESAFKDQKDITLDPFNFYLASLNSITVR